MKPKYNGFQGNQLLLDTVADALGYKDRKDPKMPWFTQDIFLSTFFYLSKRFGQPKVFDEYKQAGVWDFDVKGYTIRVELNSNWVSFIVYGDKFPIHPLSPYHVKQRRSWKKNRKLLVNEFGEKKTKAEKAILKTLWDSFFKENDLGREDYTNEIWEKDDAMQSKWFEFIRKHNNEVMNIGGWRECEDKYGEFNINSDIRHALRTLRQFLKNMTTPIYVRDVPYNIKGRMTDEDANFARRYENNIKIEYKKPKK